MICLNPITILWETLTFSNPSELVTEILFGIPLDVADYLSNYELLVPFLFSLFDRFLPESLFREDDVGLSHSLLFIYMNIHSFFNEISSFFSVL